MPTAASKDLQLGIDQILELLVGFISLRIAAHLTNVTPARATPRFGQISAQRCALSVRKAEILPAMRR